jgi:hypothetical protein
MLSSQAKGLLNLFQEIRYDDECPKGCRHIKEWPMPPTSETQQESQLLHGAAVMVSCEKTPDS